MRKVDQTIFVGDSKRLGNCVSACVATYLNVPLARVPHFIEDGIAWGDSADLSSGSHWWTLWMGYMYGFGLYAVELESPSDGLPGELLFVAGPSPRGVAHQVLYRDGVLFHDPHPSRAGVLSISEVLAFRPFAGFDHTPSEVVS